MKHFDAFKEHGDVIWNIANLLRGPYRPPQYRRVMIPLTVLRRLDCVLEKTKDEVIAMHKSLKAETKIKDDKNVPKHDDETIEKIINQKFKLTFHNTSDFTFQKLLGDPDKLAPNLLKFMAGFSSRARKIIEKFNFADEIEKTGGSEPALRGGQENRCGGPAPETPSPTLRWVTCSRTSSGASMNRPTRRPETTSLRARSSSSW